MTGVARAGGRPQAAAHRIPRMTEDQLLDAVRAAAQLNGFLVYHTHRSDKSESGFPDLVLLRPPLVLWRELKTDQGRLSATQEQWLHKLRQAGQDVGVWRPADLRGGRVAAELSRARRGAPT